MYLGVDTISFTLFTIALTATIAPRADLSNSCLLAAPCTLRLRTNRELCLNFLFPYTFLFQLHQLQTDTIYNKKRTNPRGGGTDVRYLRIENAVDQLQDANFQLALLLHRHRLYVGHQALEEVVIRIGRQRRRARNEGKVGRDLRLQLRLGRKRLVRRRLLMVQRLGRDRVGGVAGHRDAGRLHRGVGDGEELALRHKVSLRIVGHRLECAAGFDRAYRSDAGLGKARLLNRWRGNDFVRRRRVGRTGAVRV